MASPALPITGAQQHLLLADSRARGHRSLHRVTCFDLDPALPAEAVTAALAVVVTVQPALRQVFAFRPEPHALLAAPPRPEDLAVERVDASPAGYADALAELAHRLREHPFDLTTGPAYRFGHLRATDGSAAALLLCRHHIVGDDSSTAPIQRDLESALALDRPAAELATRRQERESAFLRELNAHDRAAAVALTAGRVESFAQRLADTPPLVLDPRPGRPAATDRSGGRCSAELTADLDGPADVLLTAAYAAALARHGGVSKVLVGRPVTVRRTPGATELAGHFTSSLPVPVEVDWSQSVEEFLGRTVRAAVDRHRTDLDVAPEHLVEHLREQPDDGTPLFAAALIVRDVAEVPRGRAVRGAREVPDDAVTTDVCLTGGVVDGRWRLELTHDQRLISAAAAEGLLDSLCTALRRALADRSRPLRDLFTDAPVPPGEPAPNPLPNGGLAGWIGETARRTPDAVAVEEMYRTLTYRELAAAVAGTANGLRRRGTRDGDIVGLAVDGLCEAVTAMLAVLSVGATYLPLDPDLPWERLARMVGQAGTRLVIGQGMSLPGATTVRLAELSEPGGPDDSSGDSSDDRAGRAAEGSGAPVYLMFTSGSTGLPKGVVMGQGPLLNLAGWQIAALEHDSSTRFLQYSPLSFDVSYQEIFPTLAAGGTVVSREPVDRRDFPALVERVAKAELTHIFLPAAALRPFVQATRGAGATFPALRRVCVSGEQLLVDDEVRRFFADHPRCALINLYGPTETNAATVYRLDAGVADWPSHVPIGRPLPGVTAYVVDRTGHLAPVGVPGELYLGGAGVADGYLDPERTAASFLPDPYAAAPGAHMYRTGDLAVRAGDGTLIFLGRQDTQLKIRGYRVELGEIEAVAGAIEGVRQAVAVARGTGPDREVVLFVVVAEGDGPNPEPSHEAIRAHLSNALPSYMVPTWIFDTDSVPTSHTGKTDRDALVELADRLIAGESDRRVEYADDLERDIAGIWAAALETGGLGREQSLLERGAHSLNIMTVFAEIQQRYGTTVAVPDFFRSPNIAALAALVRADLDRTAAAR